MIWQEMHLIVFPFFFLFITYFRIIKITKLIMNFNPRLNDAY